jgi:hypothetical protein
MAGSVDEPEQVVSAASPWRSGQGGMGAGRVDNEPIRHRIDGMRRCTMPCRPLGSAYGSSTRAWTVYCE